uniref:Uncharacterized protein n=1 Tax=Anguilla anguilla TaxID=7936 RepID=A0A0E9T0S5_ANGAN
MANGFSSSRKDSQLTTLDSFRRKCFSYTNQQVGYGPLCRIKSGETLVWT